jgi:hypothetical protein
MPHNEQHHPPSPRFTVAIIIAGLISGAILLVTIVLVMMCHFTNNRRKTVQQGCEDVEMVSKGCDTEVRGCKQIEGESDGLSRG